MVHLSCFLMICLRVSSRTPSPWVALSEILFLNLSTPTCLKMEASKQDKLANSVKQITKAHPQSRPAKRQFLPRPRLPIVPSKAQDFKKSERGRQHGASGRPHIRNSEMPELSNKPQKPKTANHCLVSAFGNHTGTPCPMPERPQKHDNPENLRN